MEKKRAFTLIELLVVIAIIGLLLAIILPALRVAKMQATGIVCSANNRALAQSWHLYTEDNDARVCEGNTYNDEQWLGPPRSAAGVLVTTNIPVSLEDEIRGYWAGVLWSYLESEKIYHCPGDSKWTVLDRGYRSTSITGMMNGESWNHAPNTTPPAGYALKMSDIISPGDKYVFIENVDPRGWNMGSWIMGNAASATPGWIDPIAIFHAEKSTFGFADGHAEKHRWLGQTAAPAGGSWQLDQTIPWAKKATDGDPAFQFGKSVNWGTPEEQDIRFLARGYIPGR